MCCVMEQGMHFVVKGSLVGIPWSYPMLYHAHTFLGKKLFLLLAPPCDQYCQHKSHHMHQNFL